MTGNRKIVHPSLVDRLVEHVFDAVLTGDLKTGAKVTEDELASGFGVSRTPVREAVKRLAEMGVLVIHPRSRLEVISFGNGDVEQITQLRVELECFALRLAMKTMTPGELAGMEKLAGDCENALKKGVRSEIFKADSRFHLSFAEYSHNRYLLETLKRLDVKIQLCRMITCASMPKIEKNVRFHRQLLDAIRKGNADEAESLLKQHIGVMFDV